MKKKSKKIIRIFLIFIAVVILCLIIYIFQESQTKKITLSNDGLKLLNKYELPLSKLEENKTNTCMKPYEVGDGRITFGPGITYKNKETGLDEINKKYHKYYTLHNDCIDLNILLKLEKDKLKIYENYVLNVTQKNGIKINQNQFDALVLLTYNSSDILKYPDFLKLLKKSNITKSKYIKIVDAYYRQFPSYFDNPNTTKNNDGYGQGWYNRILDSADIYFNKEYKFQNHK